MTDKTSSPETVETVRYVTPPEYIKWANARDSRDRQTVDLRQFVHFLQTDSGLLQMTETHINDLISEYLDRVEPQ